MLGSLDNALKNQTNWLMPIGVRECNLNIQDSSSLLRLTVLDGSNFCVHHFNTENIMCVWLCPSLLKCRDTGVIIPSFCAEALCSYIRFLMALLVSPT